MMIQIQNLYSRICITESALQNLHYRICITDAFVDTKQVNGGVVQVEGAKTNPETKAPDHT